MKMHKGLWITMLAVAAVAAVAYNHRATILTHAVGLKLDIEHPRDANRPVPWNAGPSQAQQPLAERPPNIVVILADDMGFNDVTTYGGGGVPTPNIDAIARAGVRFDQGYAGAPICTTSRAALMTGRYPWRFGLAYTPLPGSMARVLKMLDADSGNLHPMILHKDKIAQSKDWDEGGLPASEQTIAALLKQRGYHTLHIGKWHLGNAPRFLPNSHGFDESLNMENGLYLPQDSPDVVNAKQDFDPIDRFLWPILRFAVSYNGGRWFEPAKYLTDYFTDEAVKTIHLNRNRPFFLYLAHWGVHTPLQASKADYDALPGIPEHRRRVYGAMVRSVDRSVGRVLQALRDEGLEDNTIVIFTSDNGAPNYIGLPEVNQPYRGWKITLFQGGLRVPYVAQWPGRIPAGTRYDQPVSNIDILPTVIAAAGAALPPDRVIDGVNLLPYLGKRAARQAERPLFWLDGSYRTVQDQGWKLIVSEQPKKDWLFDLAADPTERVNLATREPRRVAQLRAMLDAHQAQMPPPLWESAGQVPVMIDKTLDQKQTPADEYTYWIN